MSESESVNVDDVERIRKICDHPFFNSVLKDVYGPRNGGAIIVLDAEDARKGVGKTSGAVALAEFFAAIFNYDMTVEDTTLSGQEYITRLQDHPGPEQPSCVLWDEAVGGGSGDSRRSMAEQNRIMGQAWQLLRTKRILSFVTLPDWNDLDSRLQKLADYRIYCLREPIGYFRSYFVGTPFEGDAVLTYGLGNGDGADRVRFPDMGKEELYRKLSKKKDQLIGADTYDADDVFAPDEDDEEEEDDGYSPEDVVDEIESRDSLEAYIDDSPGGRYINRDMLKLDYDLTEAESKTTKALMKRRFDLDVM